MRWILSVVGGAWALDVIVPVDPHGEGCVLPVALGSMLNATGAEQVFLLTSEAKCQELKKAGTQHLCMDENELVPGLTKDSVKKALIRHGRPDAKPGWYFQQFLKLGVALKDSTLTSLSDDFLVWDADTIATKHVPLTHGSKRLLYADTNSPIMCYLETYKRVFLPASASLGEIGDLLNAPSYVAQMGYWSRPIVQSLINSITPDATANCPGCPWWETILANLSPYEDDMALAQDHHDWCFSEYQSYALHALARYSDQYEVVATDITTPSAVWIRRPPPGAVDGTTTGDCCPTAASIAKVAAAVPTSMYFSWETHHFKGGSTCAPRATPLLAKRSKADVPLYIINLASRRDRWDHIKDQFTQAGLPYKRVEAASATVPWDEQLVLKSWNTSWNAQYNKDMASRVVPLSPGEAGCARSHIGVWKQVAAGSAPLACVFEDDADLDEGARQLLESSINELPGGADMLYLMYQDKNPGGNKPVSNLLFRPSVVFWTRGYCVSQAGAKKLVELLPVIGPVDVWLAEFAFPKLQVFATVSQIGRQSRQFEGDSDIVHSTLTSGLSPKAIKERQQRLRQLLFG
mmetsp:Transcript_95135/g.217845  ORF Transcript_95135/g.217845 Transcript_95135/m.217845 type:complete len:576 (+) Transcript_95135:32-1759(+)